MGVNHQGKNGSLTTDLVEPLQVRPFDLSLEVLTPGLTEFINSRPDGHRLAASAIADQVMALAERLRTGEERLSVASWRRVVSGDAPLVDSFEFQRESLVAALVQEEARVASQPPDPKLSNMLVLPGPGAAILARQVATCLGVPLSAAAVHDFPDAEFKAEAFENVRKKDVYVVMPTCAPGASNVLALCQLTSLLQRASAGSITAVVPYFGFARQDRRDKGRREPISARMVADFLEKSGVNKVITIDIHAAQEEGFFNRLDGLYGSAVLVPWVAQYLDPKKSILLAPDAGSVKGAEIYSQMLGIERDPVLIHKRRKGDSEIKMSRLGGSVKGLTVVIRDDMIATGTTIAEAAKLAMKAGAAEVLVVATHAVMAGNALERLLDAPIKKIIVTDSIPSPGIPSGDRFDIVPVAPLLAEAIRRDELGESVSGLLKHTYPLEELQAPHLAFDVMHAFTYRGVS